MRYKIHKYRDQFYKEGQFYMAPLLASPIQVLQGVAPVAYQTADQTIVEIDDVVSLDLTDKDIRNIIQILVGAGFVYKDDTYTLLLQQRYGPLITTKIRIEREQC